MIVVEEIARRWFEREVGTRDPDWDAQPEKIREHYRTLATQFWADPAKLTRELQSVAIHTRQMTTIIDRATKAWT